MTNIETLKWISTGFILSNMFIAALGLVPYNFVLLAIGTSIWGYVGVLTKDKPLQVINFVGCILAVIAVFTN